MKLLALQLKRIGDLILTTPTLAAIKAAHPDAHVTLAVHTSSASLLPAIPYIDAGIVFGPGRGWTPWQQTLTGNFDHVLDFTGTDRSAAAAVMSRSRRRFTFEWVRKNRLRAMAYKTFVPSSVREHHTVDHYLHLAQALPGVGRASTASSPSLSLPPDVLAQTDRLLAGKGVSEPFVLVHPGTARAEKYWLPERWTSVITHIRDSFGLDVVVTGGHDPFEQDHIARIGSLRGMHTLVGCLDLLTLAALVQKARLVLSCDTAVVHLAAAFQRPQIALFGPTNPFHWRPRHPGAVILSAAQPEKPLTEFTPRMKGAPTERLSTECVFRATDALLAQTNLS